MIWLDTDGRRVWIGGRCTHINPQGYALVEMLVARIGKTVRHEALIGALYPNPDDEPENAKACVLVRVCLVRKLLREAGAAQRIETVPRVGYRLTAPDGSTPDPLGLLREAAFVIAVTAPDAPVLARINAVIGGAA